MKPQIEQKLGSLRGLPTIPDIIIKLSDAIEDPSCCVATIEGILRTDASTAASVLRTVNSVIFRPASGREVRELRVAITRIGLVQIKRIAVNAALCSAFSARESARFERKEFWRHNIAVGSLADMICRLVGPSLTVSLRPDLAHLAGLFHDLGKIVFEEHFQQEFHAALTIASHDMVPLLEAERQTLDTDHAQVGAWLCKRWRMAQELTEAVAHHHQPCDALEGKPRVLAALVNLADAACVQAEIGASGSLVAHMHESVPEILGVSLDDLQVHIGRSIEAAQVAASVVDHIQGTRRAA